MKKILQVKYLYLFLATFAIWVVTLPICKISFQSITPTVMLVKGMQLPLIFYILHQINKLYTEIKMGRIPAVVIKYFIGYFCVLFIAFLLIFPGGWRWDDTSIYNAAAWGQLNHWQHYLTSVFYIFCLTIFPAPFIVILGQILVISIIVVYMVYELGKYIQNRYVRLILFLPFILIPTISTNLWPMRLVIYSYLEIFLVVKLVLFKIENRAWGIRQLFQAALLTAILSVWRTEGFYYVIAIPVVFLFLFKKETTIKLKVIMFFMTAILTVLLYIPQYRGGQGEQGTRYEITGLCVPLVPLVHEAVRSEDTELLGEIDIIFDSSVLEQAYQDGKNGEYIFWNQHEYPFIKDGLSSERFDAFKQTYVKLLLKYPWTYLKNRLQYLKRTAVGSWDPKTATLYEEEMGYVKEFCNKYFLNRPLNEVLRKESALFLECDGRWKALQALENFLPQLMILLFINIWLFFRKREFLLISLVYDLRIFLTFLTAPTGWFLYYFSAYLAGLIVVSCWAARKIDKTISKRKFIE